MSSALPGRRLFPRNLFVCAAPKDVGEWGECADEKCAGDLEPADHGNCRRGGRGDRTVSLFSVRWS
jgi:hypothetical protein